MTTDQTSMPRADEVELSIVMPCLNEAETVATCVRKAYLWLGENGVTGEVIVADNGSSDGSQQLARENGARVIEVASRGYGTALRGGIAAARGRLIIMGDADDSYDFSELDPFLAKLREGYDLVMGNRFKGGIETRAMPMAHRYLGNPLLTGIGPRFFGSTVGDFNCGLRGFRKTAISELELQTTGMEFAIEMVVKATLRKLRIAEVPTTLSPAGRTRPPHLRSWRDGWRSLRFLLLYSPRWLFFYPGLLLMAGGFIASLFLLPGTLFVEKVGFDVQTLLYAAMSIVIGFQAIAFAIFTKAFAIREQLLPNDPRFMKFFHGAYLEAGLAIGTLLFCAGFAGSIWAVFFWRSHGFGPLDTSKTLRIIIPSVTALTLGFQVILASFFLSVLGLKRGE